MISFDAFTMEDGSPIYTQIILYIKRGIVAGMIRDGDELPSRRALSSLLGVNPNTVQKAYHLLEEQLLMQSRSGAKSCMVLSPDAIARVRRELVERDVKTIIHATQQMGISKEELLDFINELWDKE